jgi:dolichol-phosphate mannosyltransferase
MVDLWIGCQPLHTPDITIVVPTFQEAENLPRLLPRILDVLEADGIAGNIIIVDDNSPDDTAEICEPFIKAGRVRLEIRQNERGLSGAVLHGIDLTENEIVVVMDADLSHPPEAIPRLIQALRDGADMVIGSRYIAGGSTADDWTVWRLINSKIATSLAWPLTSLKDPMAGFFAIRRDRVDSVRSSLNPLGYKIGLELIVKCRCINVTEVPIRFEDRAHGQSKLNLHEQINYLRHMARLYRYCILRKLMPGITR